MIAVREGTAAQEGSAARQTPGSGLQARESPARRTPFLRTLLVVSGTASLGLGIAGIFLPVLPTTPFLLLAAACYARGSKRLHRWLMENRVFGRYIKDYIERRGVSLRVKIVLLPLLWGTIAYSALFAVHHAALKALLVCVALLVSLHIVRLKTLKYKEGSRMSMEKLKKFLDDNKVKYVSIKHSLAYTAQEIAAAAHIHGKELAKTVVVKLDGKPAMAVLPANRRIDMGRLRQAALARNVELATEQELQDLFPECALGAMPPFGNLYGMKVYADTVLAEDEEIAFNAGSHTELIRMAYKSFEGLVNPVLAEISGKSV
jgi:Ala-tRNA(Pro) deacylase